MKEGIGCEKSDVATFAMYAKVAADGHPEALFKIGISLLKIYYYYY